MLTRFTGRITPILPVVAIVVVITGVVVIVPV